MRIRTKILLIALSLILVTGAVSTIVGQFVTRNIVRKQIADKLETVAESRAHHIQTFLKTQKEAIEQLSESIVIEEFLLASEDDYDFVQKFDDVLRRLKNTAESAEYDLDVFVLDESGIIVASSDERDIGEDRSGDPYFGGAKEGAFIKDAYVSQHRKRNSLAFSAPVFDEEDPARLGVVVTRLSMEELNGIAACRTGLGKTGEIYLVNKEGYMLTPSRFVEDTFLKLKVDTENVRDCLEDLKRFGAEEHEHEAILCKNYLDTDIIGIHQHIPEMNWCLLAEVSEKEAFAPITSLTRLMLSILGVLLVLGIVVSILISGTITKPISKLHHGTDEVAGGNLDYKVGTGAKDEIGQLSRTFDSMTANLKESKARVEEYQKTLEERIEARTKQLAEVNKGLRQEIEERKQVEQRLRLFSHSVESSVDGVVLGDLEGIITYANEAFAKMFGYSQEELIGTEIPFLYAESQLHKLEEALQATREGGWTGELIGRRKNGGLFPVEVSSSAIVDDEGRIIAQVANHRDITERKVAEEGLRESEEKYRDLFENASDLIQSVAPDGRFIYVNRAWRETLGYDEEEVARLNMSDIIHPDSHAHCMKVFQRVVSGEAVGNVETVFVTKGGKKIVVEGTADCVFREGKPHSTRGIFRDITERRLAEEVLRESEERYRTLLENLPQKIFYKDKRSVYVSCNENYALDLKIKPEEIAGKTDYDFYPKELAEKYRADDRRLMESGETEDIEEKYVQHGKELFVHTAKTPVRDEGGNVVGILGVFWDITEHKRAEEEIKQQAAFVRNNPAPVLRSDYGGRILTCNSAAQETFGRDLAGESIHDLFTGAATNLFEGDAIPKLFQLEQKIKDKAFLFTVKQDEPTRSLYIYGSDITEPKRAEAEQERLIHDVTERVKELNCLYRISDLVQRPDVSLDEIMQGTVDLIPPSWQYPEITCARIVLEGQEFRTENFRETIWKQASDTSAHGAIIGNVQVYYLEERPQIDEGPFLKEERNLLNVIAERLGQIVERKRAEEVLVATRARLEHLLLSSPAVIYSCEPKGNYPPTFISENVKEQLGYEPREFVDDPKFWAEHIHPEDAPRVFAELSHLFEQGHHVHEYRFQREDGTYRWMRDELRLVRGADGNPLEIVGSWIDTTERKKAEEALGEAEAERRRITEALREAEKLAVVGEMAGRVAHEVLNPITALLSRTQSEADCTNVTQEAVEAMKEIIADWQGNLKNGTLSEYLLEKSPGGKDTTYGEEDLAILSQAVEKNADNLKRSQEFLSFFEHHIMRVVEIIDNLRQMAQARREIEEVDVNNCLKEVAGLFQDGLDKRKITLLRRLVPGLPKVYVDRTELFQVFSNLLRNAMLAVDSKGEGGGEIAFTSELMGEEIWVRVIDNGVGVSEENKLLIFEHDFSTKSEKEGTGLGLAISRRLVREMGGELLLESSLSEGGSTFLVRLPLTKATKIAEIDTEKAIAV